MFSSLSSCIKIFCLIIGFLLYFFTTQIVGGKGAELKKKGGKLPTESLDLTDTVKWAEKEETNKNYKQALELFDKVIHIYEQELGPEHPKTIDASIRKYRVYYTAQMYNKALELGWKIYKTLEKIHGTEHPDTVEFLSKLSYTYSDKRNYEKAEQLLKRAYRLTKAQLGQNHPKTIKTLFNLADAMRNGWRKDPKKKFDSALRYYKKVYNVGANDLYDPKLQMGEERIKMFEMTVQALRRVGDILGLQHKYAEAAEIFQKVFDIRTKTLGEGHPLTQELKQILFHILTAAGQTGQAKKILGKEDQELDQDEDSLYLLVQGKAAALVGRGKPAKAVEILTELYEQESSKTQNRRLPSAMLSVLEELVRLNMELADFDQAEKWAHVLIDLIQGQGQGQNQKLKVTTTKEGDNLILLYLGALEVLISIQIRKNAEKKLDHYSKTCAEVTKGHLQSFPLVEKLYSITKKVADFKLEIGKRDEAIQVLSDFITLNPPFFVLGLDRMTTIALGDDDYKLMEELALKFLSNDLPNPEEELEEEKLEIRDRVAQYLCEKASELLTLEKNYEEAFSLYKTVEAILPLMRTEEEAEDDEWPWLLRFLEGISNSALMLGKFNEALVYTEKENDLLKRMLAREPNKQKRVKIGRTLEISQKLQELLKNQAALLANFGGSLHNFQLFSPEESESEETRDRKDKSEL